MSVVQLTINKSIEGAEGADAAAACTGVSLAYNRGATSLYLGNKSRPK
jgi:hypothetical protein